RFGQSKTLISLGFEAWGSFGRGSSSGERGTCGGRIWLSLRLRGIKLVTEMLVRRGLPKRVGRGGECLGRDRLERAKGFEPSTPTLARLCSTPELRPRSDPAAGSRRVRG